MTTKAKRKLSNQINQILKENHFYRLGGGWKSNILHIGVQPEGRFTPEFDNEVASKNFKKSVKQIKGLKSVGVAKSKEWCSGWHVMAGIELIVS